MTAVLLYSLTKTVRISSGSVHRFFTIRHQNLVYCKYKDEAVGEPDAVEISADDPTAYP